MTTLFVTQGLPGSGKTTWARMQKAWRVNRDDIRAMLMPIWPHGDSQAEHVCTIIHHATIERLLISGRDVVCDDTNLNPRVVRELKGIADICGAEFIVQDFTDVPLDTCISRDALRPYPVGPEVIIGMYKKYLHVLGEAK